MIKKITLDFRELGRNSNPKVVGVRNGAGQIIFDDFFFHNHPHFTNIFFPDVINDKLWWKKWTKWKEYGSSLSQIKLEKTAIITDYISTSGLFRGIFVSNRFKKILQTANLPNHIFFEITFIQGEKVIGDYWWFCFDYETGEETVDFSKCEYSLRDHKKTLGETFSINIQSYQDYINVFYKTGKAVKITELAFNSNFDYKLDIWGTQFLTNQIYISDKLHKKLQEQNITGYTAHYPTSDLYVVGVS